MSWWRDQVAPRLSDRALDNAEVGELRAGVCEGLAGDIVEIGFGSGLNVAHYPDTIRTVAAIDPSEVAWVLAGRRIAAQTIPVTRGGLDGQRVARPDESADAVLSTFTLCTVPDAELALAEIVRLLRPGGTLHFLEHGLAPEPGVRRWQRRLEPLQDRVFAGCHLTRAFDEMLTATALVIDDLQTRYMPGPAFTRPWGYLYAGVAHKPA